MFAYSKLVGFINIHSKKLTFDDVLMHILFIPLKHVGEQSIVQNVVMEC